MDITKMSTFEIARYLREDRKTAFILWQVEDIMTKAYELNVMLTRGEAEEILCDIQDHSDCVYGITWETLACGILDFDRNR